MSGDNEATHIEKAIRAYAGSKYAEPKDVPLGTIDFEDYASLDDLIEALTEFRDEHSEDNITQTTTETKWNDYPRGFAAHRLETPEEVAARVSGYREYVARQQQARRAEYERMKAEFGDS